MKRRDAIKNISIGMGLTISTGTLMTMISACKNEPAVVADSWVPKFLKNKGQSAFIENLAESIFPATNTPGAKEAGVVKYIDMIVADVYEPKEQERFQKGMEICAKMLGGEGENPFSNLHNQELTSFLEKLIGAKADKEVYDTAMGLVWSEDPPEEEAKQETYYLYSFLSSLKNLTVSGYFGSKLIATEHMNYQPVPGPFEGCIDYSGNDYSLD